MEATWSGDVSLPRGIYLEEGDWSEIYNFKLKRSFELIRQTRCKYNIKFTDATVVTKIQPIIDSNFLCLANFSSVLKDLCGAIVSVGDLQQIGQVEPGEIYSYQNTRIEFCLIDTHKVCCIWKGSHDFEQLLPYITCYGGCVCFEVMEYRVGRRGFLRCPSTDINPALDGFV
ncbi:hypothetical protein Bca101_059644 [Brassica carinata]